MQNFQFSDQGERGEGREFYRQFYKNSPNAIAFATPDGEILAANPAACAMFRMTEDEIKQSGQAGLLDTSDPNLIKDLKERKESGKIHATAIGIRKDGTRFPLELSSSVFEDENGEFRTVVMFRDISEREGLEARLQENNKRLKTFIENLPDAIYTLDLTAHRITSFNRTSFLGYSYAELTGPNSIQEHIHPEDAAAVAAYWQKVITGTAMESIEYRVKNKSGQWDWVDSRKAYLSVNADGTPKEIMVVLRVITERKNVEEQVAYHAKILENVNDVIIGTDENFIITYWNSAAQQIFGWEPKEVIGKPAAEVLRTVYSEGGREESIREINETGTWKGEAIQFTKDDRPVNIDANIMMIRNNKREVVGFVSANRDITKRKQTEQKLIQANEALEAANRQLQQAFSREQILARTDSLTGLFNRRHFFLLAEHELSVAERYQLPLSLIIFDIDHFKLVNDSWGHQMGDDVLANISRITHEQVRAADILARYGGEEFIILLPNSSVHEAENVAERIRKGVMSYRLDPEHTQASVTVSIGIAGKTAKINSLDHLIRCADKALYAAKQAGRNCVKTYTESG
jgi:diguanylate cyclase (GGDEF)-like protein/PAS domain S-box-containing protein